MDFLENDLYKTIDFPSEEVLLKEKNSKFFGYAIPVTSEEEIKELLETPNKKDFITVRKHTIIWMLASTGIRARELRELRNKNVDMLNRAIKVNEAKNKKPRRLSISKSFYDVLLTYIEIRGGDGEDYLFPTMYKVKIVFIGRSRALEMA